MYNCRENETKCDRLKRRDEFDDRSADRDRQDLSRFAGAAAVHDHKLQSILVKDVDHGEFMQYLTPRVAQTQVVAEILYGIKFLCDLYFVLLTMNSVEMQLRMK